MSEWREFLEDTVGRHLYEFWLDCEFYKDSYVDDINRLARNRLFRSGRSAFIYLGWLYDHIWQLAGDALIKTVASWTRDRAG